MAKAGSHLHTHKVNTWNHWHEVKTSPTAELIKHVSTTHTLPNKTCCTKYDCVAHTGSITGSSLPRDPSETEVQHPAAAAPLPPTRCALREQSTQVFIKRIMPACTCVYMYEWIFPPQTLQVEAKVALEPWRCIIRPWMKARGDKHSWTMRPSFTPCWAHTHLKPAYPQCNTWLKWIAPLEPTQCHYRITQPAPRSHKCQLWVWYNPSGPSLSTLYPIQLVLMYFNKNCFRLILPWHR